jgi:hypothetical protein
MIIQPLTRTRQEQLLTGKIKTLGNAPVEVLGAWAPSLKVSDNVMQTKYTFEPGGGTGTGTGNVWPNAGGAASNYTRNKEHNTHAVLGHSWRMSMHLLHHGHSWRHWRDHAWHACLFSENARFFGVSWDDKMVHKQAPQYHQSLNTYEYSK